MYFMGMESMKDDLLNSNLSCFPSLKNFSTVFQTYNKLESYATELYKHSLSGVCIGELSNKINI